MDPLTAGRLNADHLQIAWRGAVTAADTPRLREQLFELLNTAGGTSLRVDVRAVTSIDQAGVAALIGARRRAANSGRTFVLIDSGGAVTQALSRMHLLGAFLVTQAVPAGRVGRAQPDEPDAAAEPEQRLRPERTGGLNQLPSDTRFAEPMAGSRG